MLRPKHQKSEDNRWAYLEVIRARVINGFIHEGDLDFLHSNIANRNKHFEAMIQEWQDAQA